MTETRNRGKRRSVEHERKIMKIDEWPLGDQDLWYDGLSRKIRITQICAGDRLSNPSLTKYADGYGRWMMFLQGTGRLDETARPSDRVTPDNVADYFDELCRAGNSTTTVHGRMVELKCILAIMEPGRDFSWLTCPDGQALEATIGTDRRPRKCPDPVDLYNWGIKLMVTAHLARPHLRAIQFRDGLIIAIFASRAPRVRTMASAELGRNIFLYADGPWISFTEEDLKNKRTLEYGLPESLEPYFYQYVTVERPKLLKGRTSDALWLTAAGLKLSRVSIQCRIKILSLDEFGYSFGPHTFRYSLGTKGVMLFPDNPGVIAAVLGITGKILEKHYNLAVASVAVGKFHAVLKKERQATSHMAKVIYGANKHR